MCIDWKDPLNVRTNAGLTPSDLLVLLPLCTLLNLITNLCVQPLLSPLHPDSPKPTIIPSSTAEGGSTSERGQMTNLSGFIDRSSWYWESRSGQKTAPAVQLHDSKSGLAWTVPWSAQRRVKPGRGVGSWASVTKPEHGTTLIWGKIAPEKVGNYFGEKQQGRNSCRHQRNCSTSKCNSTFHDVTLKHKPDRSTQQRLLVATHVIKRHLSKQSFRYCMDTDIRQHSYIRQ